MVQRLKETGHSVFKSISALSRGIENRKNNRDTYTSTRTLRTQNSCVARKCQIIQKRIEDENVKLNNFECPILTEFLGIDENRLSSSGIFC